ncbi:putative 4.1 G protein [Schistosoma mansoni]|uniref:putative 4.1 G protein n=1 Tax=Schistosoma mansoni TaxID=6183 RepID=UPI0001A632E6|nr:putative 4.1 G protein [Schistosoma mansoni]|eukprot:XP_018655073.1 putative 4.1 G protein [Schistosoma mansoni]
MDGQCIGKGLRMIQVHVLHLDDTIHTFQISGHSLGEELFATVVDRFRLLEADYFDLEYVNDEGLRCWLDHNKTILRQYSTNRDFIYRFSVKFYTPHPNLLEEAYTRYLFALQIKRDLVTGTLLCSENTAALLASYIVQAEIGDFIQEEYRTISYLKSLKLLHEPNDERLRRVREFHKSHVGLTPTEADFALLDTARKIEFYGVRLHFARDHEGLALNLAVTHLGLLVFQNLIKVNTFSWAKIRKLSFKRKRFLVKLHPENYDTIEFIFDSRDECKQFWKKSIEHHTFFRCTYPDRKLQRRSRLTSSGSSFRYLGRTEQELQEYVQRNCEKRPPFERYGKEFFELKK